MLIAISTLMSCVGEDQSIVLVNANERLQKDDTVWVVGEHDDVYRLIQSEQ